MPDILGWVIFRGSKHTNLLTLDLPSLTVRGLALPARSRFGEGRSKVLQENHPYGSGFISISGFFIRPEWLHHKAAAGAGRLYKGWILG